MRLAEAVGKPGLLGKKPVGEVGHWERRRALAVWRLGVHRSGLPIAASLVALSAAADSAGLFCGAALGRRRLLVAVSPNKTVEGEREEPLSFCCCMQPARWRREGRGAARRALRGLGDFVAQASWVRFSSGGFAASFFGGSPSPSPSSAFCRCRSRTTSRQP